MSEDDKPKRKGAATLAGEAIERAEEDADEARKDAKDATAVAIDAWKTRADSAERWGTLWARGAAVVFAAFALENMMIFGMTAFGLELPGGIGLSLSRDGAPSGTAPLPVMSEEESP